MSNYLKIPNSGTPIGGIPIGVYALIGITTGILAYTTLADESGPESVSDTTSSILPTLDLFNNKDDSPAPQEGGGKKHRKKHRKTPKKRGGSGVTMKHKN